MAQKDLRQSNGVRCCGLSIAKHVQRSRPLVIRGVRVGTRIYQLLYHVRMATVAGFMQCSISIAVAYK